MFKPSKKEELKIKKTVKEFIKKIRIPNTKIILGGSGAKGTWLPNTHDIDIFVKFNYEKYKDKSDIISSILERYLKKKFKISKLHGSRDYFQINYKYYVFEVVPILDIKNIKQMRNITDISPLHIRWVNKYNYKDDIRKLKLLCRKNKVYGAESYIGGFSGYALEVLCIYYKGFNNAIKNIAKWGSRTVLDPEKYLKEPLVELNDSKIQTQLILVDPVDPTRNVTAALRKDKYKKLINLCKKYLRNPNKDYFKEEKFKIPKGSVILEVKELEGKKDISAAKMMKAYNFLKKQLQLKGFNIDSDWSYDDRLFYFKFKNKLDKYELRQGPFLDDKDNVYGFKKIHKTTIKKNKRYYAKIKRKYIEGLYYLKDLIKKNEVKSRIKSISFKK